MKNRKRSDNRDVSNSNNKNENFQIKSLKFDLTDKQKTILNIGLDTKKVRCLIISGPAGSSKSFLAVLIALRLLQENKANSMSYIRSLVQSKESETGYLPGSLEDRTAPFNVPLYDKLEELLYKSDITKLIKEHKIRTFPNSMLRGISLDGVTIADECQNMLKNSLFDILTRMKEHSLLILCGDTKWQNDLGTKSGFLEICSIFSDKQSEDNGIFQISLGTEDIKRSQLVKFVVERFEKLDKK